MKHVTVTWQPEAHTFDARGATPDRTIRMAAPHPREEQPAGIGPAENLLAALGGCTAWDVVQILQKQRQPVMGLDVQVDGDQAADAPWPFERITITYVVRGRGLDPAAVERAVRLSSDRYCSVMATVRGVAQVESVIEIVDEGAGEGTGRDAAGAAAMRTAADGGRAPTEEVPAGAGLSRPPSGSGGR